MEQYHSPGDRNRRLDRSVCTYQSRPVYVSTSDPSGRTITADDEVWIAPLGGINDYQNYNRIKYTSDDFTARAFPLGYVNHQNGATYISRLPQRQQRQGLSSEQTTSVGDNLPRSWLFSKAMEDCILGVYPSWSDALASALAGQARAFDRHFAFAPMYRKVVALHFRGRPCGMFDSNAVKLFEGKESKIIIKFLLEKGLTIHGNVS